jgi:hypothetical protein
MRYTILLDRNEKTKDIEAQEQSRFVKTVLEALEVPIDWNPDEPLTVQSKIELRKSFNTHKINVIDDMDGGLKVFHNNDLIGEWYKCSYKLKEDISQIDPKKRLYLEMNIHFWMIFENTE